MTDISTIFLYKINKTFCQLWKHNHRSIYVFCMQFDDLFKVMHIHRAASMLVVYPNLIQALKLDWRVIVDISSSIALKAAC